MKQRSFFEKVVDVVGDTVFEFGSPKQLCSIVCVVALTALSTLFLKYDSMYAFFIAAAINIFFSYVALLLFFMFGVRYYAWKNRDRNPEIFKINFPSNAERIKHGPYY